MVVTYDSIKTNIVLKNPGGRKVLINPKDMGLLEPSLFISELLPDEIPYEFIGLVKFPNGALYPKYKANVVTKKSLWLNGLSCYEKGIDIINKICHWLTWQEGILVAESIKKQDLNSFDYESENLSYWLASPGQYGNGQQTCYGPGSLINGEIDGGYGTTFLQNGNFISGGLPIRPTMILSTKIQVNDQDNVTWASL